MSRDASWLALPAGVLAAAAVLVFGPGGDVATILAVTVFCIALWIGNPVPPAVTGLLCLGLIGAAFSADLALAGFDSPAIWLVVFGLLLGEAARESGLAGWGSRWILGRAWSAGHADAAGAYRRLLFVLCLAALGLAFLIPSALVRILTVAPVVAELGDPFESEEARAGLFLGPLLVTFYAGTGIYTASLPNIIVTGIAESLGAGGVTWTEWTATLFPLMGLGRAVVVAGVVYWLFRPDPGTAVAAPGTVEEPTGDERRMFLFLLVGVAFWAADAVHGLHPVFGALLVVLLAVAPRVGVVSIDDIAGVDFSIVFFLGAVFAIGQGLSETGFTETAATALLGVVPQGASVPAVLVGVFGVTIALTFLMEGLAVASVLTPVLVSYAGSGGVALTPVLMVEAIALGTYFFPYQAAPLVAVLGFGVVGARTLIRATAWSSVLTTALLLPPQVLLLS